MSPVLSIESIDTISKVIIIRYCRSVYSSNGFVGIFTQQFDYSVMTPTRKVGTCFKSVKLGF